MRSLDPGGGGTKGIVEISARSRPRETLRIVSRSTQLLVAKRRPHTLTLTQAAPQTYKVLYRTLSPPARRIRRKEAQLQYERLSPQVSDYGTIVCTVVRLRAQQLYETRGTHVWTAHT